VHLPLTYNSTLVHETNKGCSRQNPAPLACVPGPGNRYFTIRTNPSRVRPRSLASGPKEKRDRSVTAGQRRGRRTPRGSWDDILRMLGTISGRRPRGSNAPLLQRLNPEVPVFDRGAFTLETDLAGSLRTSRRDVLQGAVDEDHDPVVFAEDGPAKAGDGPAIHGQDAHATMPLRAHYELNPDTALPAILHQKSQISNQRRLAGHGHRRHRQIAELVRRRRQIQLRGVQGPIPLQRPARICAHPTHNRGQAAFSDSPALI
jgi:hypothetical protein